MRIVFWVCLLFGGLFSCSAGNAEGKVSKVEDKQVEEVVEIAETEIPTDTLSTTEKHLADEGFLLISEHVPSVKIDLKYATDDNFTKKVLYADLTKAYLQPLAIEKLKKAQEILKTHNSEYTLLVYDAARPLSVQQVMYDAVKNTRYHLYVAHPSRRSLHNYGLAVDLTIFDGSDVLDMGTDFDYFGKEAGIYREEEFLRLGIFTKEQVNNRKLLRKVMTQAGFQTIRGEWWHFNACSLDEAKRQFLLIK